MQKSVLRSSWCACCLVVFAFGPRTGFGQSSAREEAGAIDYRGTGEVHGITRDVSGTRLSDVSILVHSAGRSADRTVSSDREGTFSLLDLRAGVYELTASKAGFGESPKTEVKIEGASSIPVDLTVDSSGQTAAATDPQQAADQAPTRRALEAPLDGIFPSSEYLGPTIGVPDTDPVWPLTQALWDEFPGLKKNKIKILLFQIFYIYFGIPVFVVSKRICKTTLMQHVSYKST